jgi:hypothetical protein
MMAIQLANGIVLVNTFPICAGGDSGGPILDRESDRYHIYAAGIILGRGSDGNTYHCYGQEFSWIRTEANVRLLWGN